MAGGAGNLQQLLTADERQRQVTRKQIKEVQKKIDEERRQAALMKELKETSTHKLSLSPETAVMPSKAGEVLVWGKGLDGQLGVPKVDKSGLSLVPLPVPALAGKHVRQIAVGKNHTLILTSTGDVFSFGVSSLGQCGHGNTLPQPTPKAIAALEGINVVQIAAGEAHSACITDTGKLLTWGSGLFGQLGQKVQLLLAPTSAVLALAALTVVKVSCGAHHTAAVTDNGRCYMFGRNDEGQLGIGDREIEHTHVPTLLRTSFGQATVSQVSCGASHTVWLTSDSKLYAAGTGKHGIMGSGSEGTNWTPQVVDGVREHVTSLACGRMHTLVLTESGGVWLWGANDHGQLGSGDKKDALRPRPLGHTSTFVSVAGGEKNSAAVTVLGELYTWGEGSFGKLGHGQESDVLTPTIVGKLSNACVRQVGLGGNHTVALISLLSAIAQDLKNLLSSQELSDVFLLLPDNKRVRAHKAILAARSQYFRSRLTAADTVTSSELKLDDMPYDLLLLLLEFIYTDQVRMSLERADRLLPVAKAYQLERLVLLCEAIAKKTAPSASDAGLQDLKGLLQSGSFADVTFVFPKKDQRLQAHKAILSARSEYFRSMFLSGMKESDAKEIVVEDVGLRAFKQLLCFLYTGEIEFGSDGSMVIELMILSHRYRVYSLKSLCEGVIEDAVTPENALMLLQVADLHASSRVKRKAMEVARANFDSVPEEEWEALPQSLQHELLETGRKTETTRIQKGNTTQKINAETTEMLEEATMPHFDALRVSKEFQTALRQAREKARLTRAEVAKKIGEKVMVVAAAETGTGVLSRNVVQKLEKALHARLMHLAPSTMI